MKKSKYKLVYVQPLLASYRKELVTTLHNDFELVVIAGSVDGRSGFKEFDENGWIRKIRCEFVRFWGGKVLYQRGVVRNLIKLKPDAVLLCASIRDLSFWMALIMCKILKIKVFSHGQGFYAYNKPKSNMVAIYKIILLLSTKYICYTDSCAEPMIKNGISREKIEVANNSIKFTSDAENVLKNGTEKDVLYLGRLREGCELPLLIEAMGNDTFRRIGVRLHVIGDGEKYKFLKEQYDYDWIEWYGAVFDEHQILEISRECKVGCYPGNAGLSILHYMSLKLPPVVHRDLPSHMGPEPSYINDTVDGFYFERTDHGLAYVLEKVFSMGSNEISDIAENSFKKYKDITTPSLGKRISKILFNSLNNTLL